MQQELTQEQMELMQVFAENAEIATGLIMNALQNQPVIFELTLNGLAPNVRDALIKYFRALNTFMQNPEIKKLIE